jgi:hypothetical protein
MSPRFSEDRLPESFLPVLGFRSAGTNVGWSQADYERLAGRQGEIGGAILDPTFPGPDCIRLKTDDGRVPTRPAPGAGQGRVGARRRRRSPLYSLNADRQEADPLSPRSWLGFLALAGPLAAAPIQHDFLAIDEGLSNLLHVDEADPAQNWRVHIGKEQPRDLQLEGGGRVLISHDLGYCEYDIATGQRLKDVSDFHDVSSVRRLPNGNLLIAGVDFDRPKTHRGDGPLGDPQGRHVIFTEFDPSGRIVRRSAYGGDFLRLIRETATGTFLCGCAGALKEADGAGHWIREIPVAGFQHPWMGVRLPDGSVLMSAGHATPVPPQKTASSFLVVVDAAGKPIRRFGAADQVPERVHPDFYAMFQVLPNQDLVVANWQGHGAGHNQTGVQILEFDPQGAIVWEWSDRASVSSVQGVLVLDGLDRALLHDERSGVMQPALSPR